MIDEFFKYNTKTGLISYNFHGIDYEIQISNIKSAVVNIDKGIILLAVDDNGHEILVGYSIDGERLFSNKIPDHYKFWYLSPSDLRIACTEKDEFADQSGRSGWWFKINIANGEMIKDSWAY